MSSILEKKKQSCRDNITRIIQSAEAGDHDAQNSMGARLACGDYCLEKDEEGAVYWYTQAIKQGNYESKWNLATMLLHGEGNLTPNITYALKLIEQAALEGENTAPLFLRDAYESGYYNLGINFEKRNYYQKLYDENKEMPELGTPLDIEKDLELKLKKPILKFIDSECPINWLTKDGLEHPS